MPPVWIHNDQALSDISVLSWREREIIYTDALIIQGEPCAYSGSSGTPLPETFLTRGAKRLALRFPFQPQIDVSGELDLVLEEAYYIAFYNTHFGHLLTETLAHSWHVLEAARNQANTQQADDAKPILIIQNHVGPLDGELMDELRLHFNVVTGRSLPTRTLVRKLRAAAPTMILGAGINTRHFDEVRRHVSRRIGTQKLDRLSEIKGHRRIYLSRERLPEVLRHLTNEEALVEELRRRGWKIIHPQEMPLGKQLRAYARASVIAGNLASAFHLLMAFGLTAPTLKNKILLTLTGSDIPRTYPIQFGLQKLNAYHLACLTPVHPGAAEERNPTLIDQKFTIPIDTVADLIDAKAYECQKMAD